MEGSTKKGHLFLLYIVLITIALFQLFPIIWTIIASLQTDKQIFQNLMPFSWQVFFPEKISFNSYIAVIFEKSFGRAMLNSFIVTFSVVVIGLVVNALAGFSLAVFDFWGKRLFFIMVLVSFMIPFESIAIPLYMVVKRLNWLETYYALIAPAVANGLAIFLFRQFFLDIPKSYIDACIIDGASWWNVFSKVFIPLSKPAVISAALILFMFQWQSFLWPLIAAHSTSLKVIEVAIADLYGEHEIFWSQIFAACSIAIFIPASIIVLLQRYFVQGVTSVGIKG